MDRSTLRNVEPQFSVSAHDMEGWEPDWVEDKFVAMMRCSIPECGEVICIYGDTTTEQIYDDKSGWGLESLLRPQGVFPAPPVISVPLATPEEVVRQLELSFEVLWVDTGACAIKLRTSLERLLDHYKIQRFRVRPDRNPGKPGKRAPLDLSSRIDNSPR